MKHVDVIIPVRSVGTSLSETVSQILASELPGGWRLGLRIVDDGSRQPVSSTLSAVTDPRVEYFRTPQTLGRAAARNLGAAGSTAEFVHFVDADCSLESPDFYHRLLSAVDPGTDVAYGPIRSDQQGIWGFYLENVDRRRIRAAARNDHINAVTTANLLIRRTLFEQVRGFHPEYRHYGFEDRDLVFRLLQVTTGIRFVEAAAVRHHGNNGMAEYCSKLREAACFSAPLLASRFPQAYAGTRYARLDPDLAAPLKASFLRVLARTDGRAVRALVERTQDMKWLPRAVQLAAIKANAALCYLKGCADRRSS